MGKMTGSGKGGIKMGKGAKPGMVKTPMTSGKAAGSKGK
jgi:hypothetical protein